MCYVSVTFLCNGIINNKTGKAEGDYITLEGENPNDESPLKMFHPVHTYKMKFIIPLRWIG